MPADFEYEKALKMGERARKAALSRNESPYLPALDEILDGVNVIREESLGLVNIPLDQIAGTRTTGRKNSFAPNFMPLLEPNSEFAMKWQHLYAYQTETGVQDPIIAYEYMNRFYVLEGNKRVSVFKYLGAYSIEGYVTRIVPAWTPEPEVRIFYEFMGFYGRSRINDVWFSREGRFTALEKIVRPENTSGEWSDEERIAFSSSYYKVRKIFLDMGGGKLPITPSDAFLLYVDIYGYNEIEEKSAQQIREELEKIWKELKAMNQPTGEALVMDPDNPPSQGLLGKILSPQQRSVLHVAFVHERSVAWSAWTYAHELGRMYTEQVFGDRIVTENYFIEPEEKDKESVIEQAIEDGCRLIFTTSERFLDASLKVALRYPEVNILNCALNRTYMTVRTYYGRMYEAKYLSGMIAGAMSDNDLILYSADYPIFGELANINAFALGAAATNPRAKIVLSWSSQEGQRIEDIVRERNIHVISGPDMIKPAAKSRNYGLYIRSEDGSVTNLAAPIWNWGKFYEKIISSVLAGNYSSDTGKSKSARNDWWGLSAGIIELILSRDLPTALHTLTRLVQDQIRTESFHPFNALLRDQKGEEHPPMSPEEIIEMEWLLENIEGSIPVSSSLTKDAQSLVDVQGIAAAKEGENP